MTKRNKIEALNALKKRLSEDGAYHWMCLNLGCMVRDGIITSKEKLILLNELFKDRVLKHFVYNRFNVKELKQFLKAHDGICGVAWYKGDDVAVRIKNINRTIKRLKSLN